MRLFFIVIWLFTTSIVYSQQQVQLDQDFNTIDLKKELSFFIDEGKEVTVASIANQKFQPYTRDFPGLQEKKFWFHLQVTNNTNNLSDFLFLVNTVAIKDLSLYQKKDNGFQKIYEFREKRKKELEIHAHLTGENEFYIEVFFTKSIYLPLSLTTIQASKQRSYQNSVIKGIYYGFAIVVILINLFFYFQTKSRFFIYYVLLALSISLILFELDGLVYPIFGNAYWTKYLDVVLHTFLLISFSLFTTNALSLRSNLPKYSMFGVAIVGLNTLAFIIYIITGKLFWYTLGEVFNAIGLFTYWLASILLFKKLEYARYLFIGYTIIYISNIIYIMPSEFGFGDIGFSSAYFKLGSVIEMIVLLYAISYRQKVVVEETKALKSNLNVKTSNSNHPTENDIFDSFTKKYELSYRESQVIQLLIKGKKNSEIAEELSLSLPTVKYHNTNIFKKLGVKKRGELGVLFTVHKNENIPSL